MTYQVLVGVKVLNEIKFNEYRCAIEPFLSTHYGMFCYDFAVPQGQYAHASGNINRVLKFQFSNKCCMQNFFSDRNYLKARGRHVLKAIGSEQVIFGYNTDESN